MNGFIYLISDTGNDNASKIGFISDSKNVWNAVPSYSPRPMRFDAAWAIPSRFMQGSGSAISQRRNLEHKLHSLSGELLHLQPGKERAGKDWVMIAPKEAQRIISDYLGSAPDLRDGHRGQTVTNDNFRNPHPTKVAANKYKVVVWLYREIGTGHLKTQYCDDWTSPHETKRRYSVNGIEELAAFTYAGPKTAVGNKAVLDAWTAAVREFGHGSDDRHYGWLKAGTSVESVLDSYAATGLSRCLRIGKGSPIPEGVKGAYNRAE
jgi:hypothetical protein